MDKDINDIFDEIVLSEQRFKNEGYEKGFEKGSREENIEGFHLGYHRGADLGAELGYYKGISNVYLLANKNGDIILTEKQISNLENMILSINNFPLSNESQADIMGLTDKIRAQYKKICSLLKVDSNYPGADKMSF